MEIDNIINDYSLRELQIISSRILSDHESTNNFIKQFKADHDSHQFYKNVIAWYIKKYKHFPEASCGDNSSITFHFAPNDGGLGDKFILVSSLLYVIDFLDRDCTVFLHETEETRRLYHLQRKSKSGFGFLDFYQIIDFYHLVKPKNKITTVHVNGRVGFGWNGFMGSVWGGIEGVEEQKIFQKALKRCWDEGAYWPINFPIREKRKNVCYMIYDKNNHRVQAKDKFITKKERRKFSVMVSTFPEINFILLEDFNYTKNVEILSKSHFIFATEGMWTHLSRAMNVYTIAHTVNIQINDTINEQGHFSTPIFDECLTKLEEKCIDLKI